MEKSVCWKCERPILSGAFGPMFQTSSGMARVCEKCATHKFVLIDTNKFELIKT